MAEVLPNGPSAQAGIQRGDKIIMVNDEQITSASHLINYVALQAPGSKIRIEVEREGKNRIWRLWWVNVNSSKIHHRNIFLYQNKI